MLCIQWTGLATSKCQIMLCSVMILSFTRMMDKVIYMYVQWFG